MDLEAASVQIDALIERRSRKRTKADELTAMWRASERAHREGFQRKHRAEWYAHHEHMQELHAALAAEHRIKAEALLLEEPTGGGGNR